MTRALSTPQRCAECGKEDRAGIGVWAPLGGGDCTPVHTGECFRSYQERQRLFYQAMTTRLEAERTGAIVVELTGYVAGITTSGVVLDLHDDVGEYKATVDMSIEDLRRAAPAFDGGVRLRLDLTPPGDES